jgi:ketosteroid isomerase-like protein
MKNRILTFVWMIGIPAIMAAGAAEDLRKEENAWAAAVVARDFPALDKIFTDQLIYAHSTGGIESKREYLDRLRTGAQRYDSINHEKIQVVSYGDSVVTHSILRMKGSSDGKPFDNHVMMLHLWVKQGGKWRLAAHQTTLLPPAAT